MNLAMFRFNFWPKPFLSPPAAHQPFPAAMEGSSFLPNPLSTPALMVLASTAENHEGARVPGQQRFTNQEKDGTPFTNPNYTMYRPGEHFPAPIYAPVHPFVRPTADRVAHSGVRIMNPVGSSAFRPVSTDSAESFHSAFSPTKRQMPEDLSHKNGLNSVSENLESRENTENRDFSMKDERPASLNSLSYETNSDSHSELDGDRGTPDSEGRSLRSKLSKVFHEDCTHNNQFVNESCHTLPKHGLLCICETGFQPIHRIIMFITISQTSPCFYVFAVRILENTVGKREIARNELFLVFPVFSTLSENFLLFSSNSKLSSTNSFSLEESKICRLGKL